MLTFAITLQTPQTDKFLDLSEPKNTIMRRLMTAATMWVTTREEMHGTMESLICIILEGVFETNSGNLRRAWAVYRRAMAAAQLMGLHRTPIPPLNCIDSELDVKPEIIWFRIVHMDRYLSLLLGLPQGTSDKSIGAVSIWENEPPLSKFERLLTVIASRILERNDRSFSTAELTTTQSIDAELLKMSMSMPSSFWRPANFHGLTPGNPDAFLETIRLGAQVYYYGLLIQLHLPYMMRISSSTEHHYAKITCVNAGREILTRFNAHRRFNPLSSCSRPVDFFALLASMTLVLAHLDAQCHKEARNVLAHQRLSDRALLQEVLDRMDGMSSIDEDTIADQSAKLIRRLLKIEADATKGNSYTARSMTGDDGTLEGKGAGDELHLQIPYLGVIKIARQGPISREPPHDQTSQVEPSQILPLATPSEGFSSPSNAPPVSGPPLSLTDNIDQRCTISAYGQSMLQCPESNHNKTTLQPPSELPLVGTGVGDWAFQGVDMAFFDSLMKGTSCVDTSELDQEWIDDPLGMDSSHL
jgi:hypothetical protein